jgi:hypothetical protein
LTILHGNCDAGQCIHVLNIHLEYIYVKGLTEYYIHMVYIEHD